MYYGRESDFESAELTIDIVNDGAISTGNVYSQPQKTGVLYNAYLIKPKFRTTSSILHFFACTIQKAIKHKFGYENKAGWEKVKNQIIKLPIKNGEIDFDFIESFVAELEAQRVAELESYLQVTGLKDYELTEEEENALYTKVDFTEFKIGELFEKIHTNKLNYKANYLPKQSKEEYTLPCLTSSFINQGLNYYVPRKDATILKNVISIPSNSDIYRAYYQSNEFTVLSDAYAIEWKNKKNHISGNQYLFMVMCINKVTDLPIYSYKNKLGGWNVVNKKNIMLPTFKNKIDFDYMDTLISAIKKLVIKDVVKYADNKISATRKVINK